MKQINDESSSSKPILGWMLSYFDFSMVSDSTTKTIMSLTYQYISEFFREFLIKLFNQNIVIKSRILYNFCNWSRELVYNSLKLLEN